MNLKFHQILLIAVILLPVLIVAIPCVLIYFCIDRIASSIEKIKGVKESKKTKFEKFKIPDLSSLKVQ